MAFRVTEKVIGTTMKRIGTNVVGRRAECQTSFPGGCFQLPSSLPRHDLAKTDTT